MTEIPEIHVPVVLKKELHEKLSWFVNNYEYEIGGWLIGEFNAEGIIVEDLLIPEQEVGYASVDTSGPALVKLRQEYRDKCKKIIGHWHSHNTMAAHWSSTDEDFIKQIIEPRERFLFIVSSKSDGHLLRLELKKPFRLSINKMPFGVSSDDKIAKFCETQIEEKVKTATHNSSYSGYGEVDYQAEEEETNADKDEFITQLISYNKKGWKVKVGPLLWYKSEELDKEFRRYAPILDTTEGDMSQYLQFDCGTKKVAKVLMRELRDFLRENISQSSLNTYRENKTYGYGYY